MLFDLRGRGRKNTVKVIYLTLAILMGGGLVLFGIGGNTSGGLVDAITDAPSGDTGEDRFNAQVTKAERTLRTDPDNAAAHIELIRARVQLAGLGDRFDANTNQYSAEGRAELRKAIQAWEAYQATEPEAGDDQARVASLMVRAYTSLDDLDGATRAQEIVADTRETAGTYSNLAVLAYQAGQTRKGDLAAEKAVELTDKDLRQSLKSQLDDAKTQALQGALQQQPAG